MDLSQRIEAAYTGAQAENMVGLAASLFSVEDEDFNNWYRPLADSFNGMSGMYSYLMKLGVALEDAVTAAGRKWGEDADWYLTIDQTIADLMDADRVPNTIEKMRALCTKAIRS